MLLLNTHAALATVAVEPMLNLTQEEAHQVATSFVAMSKHYGSVMTAKQIDTLGFIGILATVYGGRIIAIAKRKGAAKSSPTPQPPLNQFTGGIPGL